MITTARRTPAPTTRERLLREGLRLFAVKGFAGTGVGEIEAAAGLQPRRGAMYRHFPSKQALLEEAVKEHLAQVQQVRVQMQGALASDPQTFVLQFGRWMLADMDAQREMTHILEREGPRLRKIRDRFRVSADAGFAAVASVAELWARASGLKSDPKVVAAVLLGAIVNFRRSAWTLGKPPLQLSDEAFLLGVAQLVSELFGSGRRT